MPSCFLSPSVSKIRLTLSPTVFIVRSETIKKLPFSGHLCQRTGALLTWFHLSFIDTSRCQPHQVQSYFCTVTGARIRIRLLPHSRVRPSAQRRVHRQTSMCSHQPHILFIWSLQVTGSYQSFSAMPYTLSQGSGFVKYIYKINCNFIRVPAAEPAITLVGSAPRKQESSPD